MLEAQPGTPPRLRTAYAVQVRRGWVLAGNTSGDDSQVVTWTANDKGDVSGPIDQVGAIEFSFFVGARGGEVALLGSSDNGKPLTVATVSSDGRVQTPPVAASRVNRNGVAVAVQDGFLVATGVDWPMNSSPKLEIIFVSADGKPTVVDSVIQPVAQLAWAVQGATAYLVVSAPEGVYAIPYDLRGKQQGPPLQLRSQQRPLGLVEARADRLTVLVEEDNRVVAVELRLTGARGRIRETPLLGLGEQQLPLGSGFRYRGGLYLFSQHHKRKETSINRLEPR
ncbi:MAG: hypothetical protein M3Y59_22845 [Myxococcota bacterium]|nr:hypothetical protein [Myxococcota bacterium]